MSVTDHDIEDIKIKLLPTASLTANIRMAEDGEDVPKDAELSLFQADGRKVADPVSLHDGRFRIEGLPPGRAELNHLPSGYSQTVVQVGLYRPTDLSLAVTSKAGAILGTVRDEGFAVEQADQVREGGRVQVFRCRTGKYTVNGVPLKLDRGRR